MKKIKKMMALVIAFVFVLGLSNIAFAGTITVTNVKEGEDYTAYRLLNYTSDGGNAFSYYLTASEYTSFGSVLEGCGFTFTQSSDGTRYILDATEMTADDIVAALKNADLSNALTKEGPVKASADADVVFSNLDPGYWFITSSLGSLCSLASYDAQELIVEKNSIPSVDKTEKTSGDEYVDGPVDAGIGDTVHYQIVITDGTGTDAAITMTDTLSDGLDYTTGSLKINGEAVADDASNANWTVTVSGRVITIAFSDAYVAGLDTADTITITYDATINKDAIVHSATGNDNDVTLDYSKQHSEDKVYVETYDFQLYKTDGTSFLDGAGFKLYDAATGGNQITLGKDTTGYYVDADSDEEIMVDNANGVNVRGLAPGTYYLEETTVPGGYNKLAAREEVTITTGATAVVKITAVNQAGAVLPSTGGSGTTMLYIIGAILLVGAGILLVTRRRMNSN